MNPREQAPCGLSFHGLTMESMDPRIESEDDKPLEFEDDKTALRSSVGRLWFCSQTSARVCWLPSVVV